MAQRVAQPSKPADPMLGRVIAGRYRLEARIGEGGMGVVYRARHVLIDRVVALKLIRPDLRGETHLRAWMLREARAANRVDHAHIIDIHDIGETEEGELYLVMEYLVGHVALERARARPDAARARRRHPRADVRRARARPRPRRRPPRPQERQHPAHARAAAGRTSSRSSTSGSRTSRWTRASRPRAPSSGRPSTWRPSRRAAKRRRRRATSTRSASSSSRCSPGSSPSAATTARRCSRCSAPPSRRSPRSIKPDVLPAAEAIVVKLLEKDRRKRFQDAHHLHEELKTLQRSLPEHAVGGRRDGRERRAAAAAAAAAVAGRHRVGEPRGALLAHGLARLPARATPPPEVQSAIVAGVGSRVAGDAARGRGREPHAQARGARASRARPPRGDRAQGRGAGPRGVARAARAVGRAGGGRAAAGGACTQAERGGRRRRSRRPIRRTGAAAAAARRSTSAPARRWRWSTRKREQLARARAEGRRRRTRRRATSAGRSRSSARSSPATPRRSRRTSRTAARRSRRGRARALAFEKAFSEVSTPAPQPPEGQARGARPPPGAHLGDARPTAYGAEDRESYAGLTVGARGREAADAPAPPRLESWTDR